MRTRETMELARAAMGLPPATITQLDRELMELTFGDWEGLTWPEVEARDPAAARAREADKWNFVPPNGESYAATRPAADGVGGRPETSESVRRLARRRRARPLYLLAGVKPEPAASINIWQGRALWFTPGDGYRWVG